MKNKSGNWKTTKAALVLLLITISLNASYGQFLGIYIQKPKKSVFKNNYKCKHVGIQKVKQYKSKNYRIEEALIVPQISENEQLVASTNKTTPELTYEETNYTKEVVVEKKKEQEKTLDTVSNSAFRLFPQPVYFRYDSYRLDLVDLTQIALAVTYVKEGNSITLVGHTDNWGNERYNQVLSLKRATIIKDMMVELGCNESLISVKGEGEKSPAASNDHVQGRMSNRRVEFIILANAN